MANIDFKFFNTTYFLKNGFGEQPYFDSKKKYR